MKRTFTARTGTAKPLWSTECVPILFRLVRWVCWLRIWCLTTRAPGCSIATSTSITKAVCKPCSKCCLNVGYTAAMARPSRTIFPFFLALSLFAQPRARELGVPFDGTPGPLDAITDVGGIEVGHRTLISGEGEQSVRTGVTVVWP